MLAFMHIPKTGGTYLVGQTFLRRHNIENKKQIEKHRGAGVISPMVNLGHTSVTRTSKGYNYIHYPRKEAGGLWNSVHTKKQLGEYDIFTNVRNPFSWLVSWAATVGAWGNYKGSKNHYEYTNGTKSFKEFMKIISTREEYWPWKRFLFFQMFDSNGDMVIDWVNRTEELDADLEVMAQYYELEYQTKERANVSDHQTYQEYYDDELIEIVLNTWGREMGLFGYTFEGPTVPAQQPGKPVINHLNHMKDRVKYFIEEDLLFVDGKIYTGK